MTTLKSEIDASVNFIEENLIGFTEARYVRRQQKYFIAYLSSQTGCNRGCRFCHLTTTKQTKFNDVTPDGFLEQAQTIFEHYKQDVPADYMHFNFMARGEALNNQYLLSNSTGILLDLGRLALEYKLFPKFNVSTIMPKNKLTLVEIFPIITPTIYYSIYTIDESWRRKWMPAAMPHKEALGQLREYQRLSKKLIKFHCAFIEGENDSDRSVFSMMNSITDYGIRGEFNIVRYNPFSEEQGTETSEDRLKQIQLIISEHGYPCKIIPRVGTDTAASCGQFITKEWIDRVSS